jgi:hypothetical protein
MVSKTFVSIAPLFKNCLAMACFDWLIPLLLEVRAPFWKKEKEREKQKTV